MRRLIALLCVFGLTNLVFVQAAAACPLTRATASVNEPTGHEGHDMTGSMGHEMPAPDESTSHSSTSCLTMSACVVTLAVVHAPLVLASVSHLGVAATTQDLPPSLTAVPELPPPRD